jgi:hypothetical protein
MTAENNGEKELLTVEDRLGAALSMLDEYDKKYNINISCPNDVDYYINLSTNELLGLSAEDCGNGAYILSCYAAYLQKELNRELAKLNWAEHNLNIAIGNLVDKYGDGFVKFDVKKSKIIKQDKYAAALNQIIINASLVRDEFYSVTNRIYQVANMLNELQQTKRRK